MKSRKIEIWVGLFVVLAVAALLMLALQVSGLSDFTFHQQGYTVKAEFTNIGGLKARSKVVISGVTIGRITGIELEKNAYEEFVAMVSMNIFDEFNDIPNDSSAKILTSGLLGDNYISLDPGHSDEYLKQGSVIELTSQAVILEDLISKFLTGNSAND